MTNIKDLADANKHCKKNDCDGCPYQENNTKCKDREQINAEIFVEFLDMIGVKTKK